MHTLKTLAVLFCCCGLIASCGNEPKEVTSEKDIVPVSPLAEATSVAESVSDTTSVTTMGAAAIPNEVENIIDTIASKIETESTSTEVGNRALAAKEAKELEQKERRAKQKAAEKLKAKEEKKAKSSKGKPVIEFKKMVHQYGRISQGEKIKHNFVFTNTGDSDLIISNAKATCGCTQPSYPFIPIAPGEEGYIGVVFDSKGRLGRQKPMVTVTTNASPATYEIYLEGTVDSEEQEKEKEEKPDQE